MQKYCALLLAGLVLVSFSIASFAVEEEEKVEVEYSYGDVISVNVAKKEISVSEFSWENEEDIIVTYSVTPDTVFEGVISLGDIKAGDEIDINYAEKNNKKIAKTIEIYKSGIEYKDDTPESMDMP